MNKAFQRGEDEWLADEIATEFARAEGAAFVSGSGVNRPKGFLTNPVSTAGDGTRPFGTMQYLASDAAGDFAANPQERLVPLDAIDGAVLTVEGRDADGEAFTAYIRLWNHAVGTGDDAVVSLDFADVRNGFGTGGPAVWRRVGPGLRLPATA